MRELQEDRRLEERSARSRRRHCGGSRCIHPDPRIKGGSFSPAPPPPGGRLGHVRHLQARERIHIILPDDVRHAFERLSLHRPCPSGDGHGKVRRRDDVRGEGGAAGPAERRGGGGPEQREVGGEGADERERAVQLGAIHRGVGGLRGGTQVRPVKPRSLLQPRSLLVKAGSMGKVNRRLRRGARYSPQVHEGSPPSRGLKREAGEVGGGDSGLRGAQERAPRGCRRERGALARADLSEEIERRRGFLLEVWRQGG